MGTAAAGILFAVALLASGQSSTLTGTLAGQIVMEGFLRFRIRPVIRRLITRSLAIVPASIVLMIFGEKSAIVLLILSQVVLSMQLSFAIIPLIHFTSDKQIMGSFANKLWVKILAWITAVIVLSLNIKLIVDQITDALQSDGIIHTLAIVALPILMIVAILLFYIIIKPFYGKYQQFSQVPAKYPSIIDNIASSKKSYAMVGAALEGSEHDAEIIRTALDLVHEKGSIVFIHIVSSAAGYFHKEDSLDTQTREAEKYLNRLKESVMLPAQVSLSIELGFGSAPEEIIRIAEQYQCDILVLGAHGHRGLADVLHGTTVSPVRHALHIPIFIVQ